MNTKEFKAEIIFVNDGKYIVLDQTAFYPKSGGVDCDTGIFYRLSDNEEFNEREFCLYRKVKIIQINKGTIKKVLVYKF